MQRLVITALVLGVFTARPASPAVLRVTPAGKPSCGGAKFNTIQSALDAAADGDVIRVCPGTYPEQLVIKRRVTIRGVGTPFVTPAGMAANATDLQSGGPLAAVVVVEATATLRGLRIDAGMNGLSALPACDPAMPQLVGVFFRNAGGTVRDSEIVNVALDDLHTACDRGIAVLIQGDGATSSHVSLRSNQLTEYQRAGVVANGNGINVDIRGNQVVGAVKFDLTQNGIQIGYGARARVVRNDVRKNAVPLDSAGCAFDGGELFFQADGGLIARNTFTGNAAGIAVMGSHNRIVRNTLDGILDGIAYGFDGIAVFGDANLLQHNVVRNMSEVGIRAAGVGNRIVRNRVTDTHAASVCSAYQALPGCAPVITSCGVGLRVAGTNQVVHNTLATNDTNMQDDGTATETATNYVPAQ